jgi:ribosomal protein S18 acetylase RimI-like enzyme
MNNTPIKVEMASAKDAEEILDLQKLTYITEAEIYDDYTIPPLTQTLPEMLDDFLKYTVLKATSGDVIVGSVRGQLTGDCVYVGRLMVDPEYQNKGLGTRLMLALESAFPQAKKFTLGTGHRSERNLYLYRKLGYKIVSSEVANDNLVMVHLEKTKS